ncbi:MAG: lipid-A-disaccharide synthase [Methylotenera sp.]|nr:lipid-A-disaccharide synthase [Oligoflexia bacterium]
MKILISAAEASSDIHGAVLLKALREQAPAGVSVHAYGVGGPLLQAQGLKSWVDARELLSMGFTEVLGKLPRIFKALALLAGSVVTERPDVAVVIDYPDFHFRLAKRLKKKGVPVVYYIPPKVWVWRKKRIEVIRALFTKVLCIFPFEKKLYEDAQVPARYVGNPLLDELPLELTQSQARASLGLEPSEKVLVILAGSRPSELDQHLVPLLTTARNVAEKLGKIVVLMPLPQTSDLQSVKARVLDTLFALPDAESLLQVRVTQGNSAECMVAADVGLIKSGTSTLEAGLLNCPHIVVYKTSWFSEWVFRKWIQYEGPVGLVNLVSGWEEGKPYLVRELICEEFTQENLTREALALFTEPARRETLKRGFARLRECMSGDANRVKSGDANRLGPSALAAQEIWAVVMASRQRAMPSQELESKRLPSSGAAP